MFTHRNAYYRTYPGVLRLFVVAVAGYGAYLLGFRLPLHVASWLQWLAELLVAFFIWKAWKATLKARRVPIRLFRAQDMLILALLTQAIILLLPG